MRNRLMTQEDLRGASVSRLDAALGEYVAEELRLITAQAAEQGSLPRLFAGHFSVSGASFGSERSVMLGRDLVVSKGELTDRVWDYVALGHIHKHQNLTAGEAGAPPVVYSGSLERIDFGEDVEDKGFCWINLERGATTWEFIKVAARPFVTLKVDGRADSDPTATIIARIRARDLRGAIVRVIVSLQEAQAAGLREREIEKALREAEVNSIAAIAKDVDRPVRTQLGGVSPETLSPAELVERYFIHKGRPPEEAARLAEAAQELFQAE
jgi:exonuclease SbcD